MFSPPMPMESGLNNKVLIIAYYWPPSGGGGVQRWLKFVKYLPQFGIEPHVLIPQNASYPQIDPSLEKDIPPEAKFLNVPIWEPYDWYQKITGQDKKKAVQASSIQNIKKGNWRSKLALWVRSNVFIPDARMFWIKPGAKQLLSYIQKHQIRTIISTGPPHSCHVMALRAKSAIPSLKWIADFRDPWTEIDFYHELSLTKWADRKHRRLEKKVLQTADHVVAVGNTMSENLSKKTNRPMHVITNGFDLADFDITKEKVDKTISITHVGTLGKARNPGILWKALKHISDINLKRYERITLRLIGNVDRFVFEDAERVGVAGKIEHIPYLKHKDVLPQLLRSEILLLLVNDVPTAKGILTGKIFEYMATGRPILAIGPKDGDLDKVLKEFQGAKLFDFKDEKGLRDYLMDYLKQETNIDPASRQYTREALTKRLVEIIQQ